MNLKKFVAAGIGIFLIPASISYARTTRGEGLKNYIERMQQEQTATAVPSSGSLWRDDGRLANMAADYKAVQVGDIVTILVVQDVQASSSGDVTSGRSFSASSGIDALAGRIRTGGVQEIFSPHSTEKLQGKAQAATKSSLRTSLAGRVAAVLPNGVLVVEAERQITMNNEHQTLFLRGLVRPGDVSPANVVVSTAISNLELELKGKGVISDATRRPNPIVRVLLRLLGF
jgi:flagellar L-ring protein precursor FlgH